MYNVDVCPCMQNIGKQRKLTSGNLALEIEARLFLIFIAIPRTFLLVRKPVKSCIHTVKHNSMKELRAGQKLRVCYCLQNVVGGTD